MNSRIDPKRRRWAVPAIAAAAALVAVIVFWRPLVGWFTGESVQPPAGAGVGQQPGAFDAIEPLPDAFVAKVQAAQEVYDSLRGALAADRLDEAKRVATVLDDALGVARQQSAGHAGFAEAIDRARAATKQLEAAADLEQARAAFGPLSETLVELASHDPRLQQGWHLFLCPMEEGKPRWMQRGDAPENPFMGPKMLACAAPQSFTPEAGSAAPGEDEVAWYTCSMHPSVRQHAPGQCPICGMDLQPVTKASLRSGEVRLDEAQQRRIGLRTSPVVRAPLKLEIQALGRVTVDETKLEDVTLRIKGWIQELKVDTTGQPVKRGEVLFTLYSPELYAAQQEYLLALESRSGDESLARASKAKLRLLGVSDAQIARVAKGGKASENVPFLSPASGYVLEKNVVEGAAVEPGQRLYRIAPLDRLWIEADVYEGDLPNVEVGQQAEISLPYLPGKTFTGKVTYVYPVLEGKTRTGRVRIELDNRGMVLKPEMYADVKLVREASERLQVPASAVLYTGPRRIVFVDKGGGRLVPRDVKLGARAGDFYEVVDGLKEGDRVVTAGNFLVAAESRIQSATDFWSGGER